ncbi:phospholipid scramblase 2-like isoform X3 [Candoia aspera]|uniref:phospholipid scramblase 2-like isoform X2 n=1 Tax=Candoia aspera TaxID=51853 RepID=UPI002FD83A35
MQSNQPPPTEPPPGYQGSGYPGPGYPGPGYPGPGYPAAQVQAGIPQYASGFPQYGAPSTFPVQPNAVAYGAVPVPSMPAAALPVVWMPTPPATPKCPPGLEYLSQIDQLSVEQQIELMEMISGYETCNRYEIKNSVGEWIYFAAEENDDYTLNCYGPLRSFTIKLFDSKNQPVIQLSRAFHCSICCCPCICCLQELEVQAPLGTVIGYINQTWHPCLPKFVIQNEARESVLKLHGPCVPCRIYEDIHFEVKSLDEKTTVGKISKKWTGIAREVATDASSFLIQFPMDLEIKMKALVLGACFLLDFMFFERGISRRENRT